MNRVLLIFLLFVGISAKSQIKERAITFNDKRFVVKGGVFGSPVNMLVNKADRRKLFHFFNPKIQTEFVINSTKSLVVGYQIDYNTFQATASLQNPVNPLYSNIPQQQVDASMVLNNCYFQYRKYSTNLGTYAPLGRYISIGFSINQLNVFSDAYSYISKDSDNNQLEVNVPAQTFRTDPYGGMRFSIGNSRFFGKKLNRSLEIELSYEIKLIEITDLKLKNESQFGFSPYQKAIRYNQINSILQLSMTYGFGL